MNASTVAQRLLALGLKVTHTEEGDDLVDGEVRLSDAVHVQVGTHDCCMGVVRESSDGSFMFYPLRRSYVRLAEDARRAMAEAQGPAG